MSVDLNAIREAMLQAQRNSTPTPPDPGSRVSVTNTGRMQLGPVADPSSTSKVQHGTFAASTRELTDLETARNKMPPNTQWIEAGGVKGWAYSFTTEFGRKYEMLAYFNGSEYRVLLIAPTIEGQYNAHNAHLYSDGHICLREGGTNGQPSLEEAFSKSVLWANGMDVHIAGHDFPFSINNL